MPDNIFDPHRTYELRSIRWKINESILRRFGFGDANITRKMTLRLPQTYDISEMSATVTELGHALVALDVRGVTRIGNVPERVTSAVLDPKGIKNGMQHLRVNFTTEAIPEITPELHAAELRAYAAFTTSVQIHVSAPDASDDLMLWQATALARMAVRYGAANVLAWHVGVVGNETTDAINALIAQYPEDLSFGRRRSFRENNYSTNYAFHMVARKGATSA